MLARKWEFEKMRILMVKLLIIYENWKISRKSCQTTEFSRPKRLVLCKWESKSVANFSRENGDSRKWGFGVKMLAQKTKMGSHLLASVLYTDSVPVPPDGLPTPYRPRPGPGGTPGRRHGQCLYF